MRRRVVARRREATQVIPHRLLRSTYSNSRRNVGYMYIHIYRTRSSDFPMKGKDLFNLHRLYFYCFGSRFVGSCGEVVECFGWGRTSV